MNMMEMNTLDFQKAIAIAPTVIIPIGACEVWGPHLPMGADTIMAQEIAKLLSEKTGWVIGPSVAVGNSIMVWGPGTVTVKPENLRAYLQDICESLVKHGVKQFVFMSPHVGNTAIVSEVAWKMRMENNINSCIFDWWRFIQPVCTKESILENEGWMAHGHASEAGTSCFLYLRPELVKMERACKTLNKIEGFYDYPDVISFTPFAECCDTWVLGDGTKASREKGEKIVTKSLERMLEYLDKWDKYKK